MPPSAQSTTVTQDVPPRSGPLPADVRPPHEALGRRYIALTDWANAGPSRAARLYDTRLQRQVDVRIRGFDGTRGDVERMLERIATFRHPRLVQLYDVEILERSFVLFTECAPDLPFDEYVRTRRPSARVVVALLLGAAEGIAAAHAAGLAHGCLDADSIRVDDQSSSPTVKLGGFGPPRFLDTIGDESTASDHGDAAQLDERGDLGIDLRGADVRAFCEVLRQVEPPDRSTSAELKRHLAPVLTRRSADPSIDDVLVALRRASRRSPATRTAVAAGLTLLLSAAGLSSVHADACEGQTEAASAAWTETRAKRVQTALDATELPYTKAAFEAVDDGIRDYQRTWIEAHTQACGLPPDATAPRPRPQAMDCLHIQAHRLETAVSILERADAKTAEHSWAILADLAPPDECLDPAAYEADAPGNPQRATEARDIRVQLAEVQAVLAAAQFDDAQRRMGPAMRHAESLAHAPTLREALRVQAALSHAQGRSPEAAAALGRAWRLSLESNADLHEAAEIVADLATMLAVTDPTPDRAGVLARMSLALTAKPDSDPRLRAAALRSLAEVASARGDYARELELLQQAVALLPAEDEGGPGTLRMLEQRVGTALYQLGRFDEAEAQFRQRFRTLAREFTENHPRTLAARANLAMSLFAQGKYETAAEELRALAQAQRRLLGDEHPDVAKTMSNLGSAIDQLGQYEEELQAHLEALRIRQHAFGSMNAEVAESLNNLGVTAWRMRDFEASADYHRSALEMRLEILGPDHPDVGYSEQNLCLTERDLGHPDDALKHCLRGVENFEASLGHDHPNTASALTNLGNMQLRLGRPDEALAAHQRALDIRQKAYGPDHPQVAYALVNVVQASLRAGRGLEAHQSALRAWALLEAGPTPDVTVSAAIMLALTATDAGDRALARQMRTRALELGHEHGITDVRRRLDER